MGLDSKEWTAMQGTANEMGDSLWTDNLVMEQISIVILNESHMPQV